MKEFLNSLYGRLGVRSFRTKNILKHIASSFLFKGGALIANFLLVPLTLNYLDEESYGVWLTLSSFVAWFTFFDIGLGNGLRNKLTEALSQNDKELAKSYVSTAYYTTVLLSIILLLVFLILNVFIDWHILFNTKPENEIVLSKLMPIVFGFFATLLVVKLIGNIYLADQHHSIQVKIHFFSQWLSVLTIVVLLSISESSLLIFGIIFSGIPVFILLILNFIGFYGKYSFLKPNIKYFKKQHLKSIMGLGIEFFIIQVSVVILFSTDNLIISKLFSPKEVVPYNVAFKYFSIATMLFNLIMMPFWSSITEAYTKKEYEWIKGAIKNLIKTWIVVPFGLLIMLGISKWFYVFWVGEEIIVPFSLSVAMALFVLLFTFNMIFNFFINGIGKIRVQMILSVFSIVINIPLSIVFVKYFNMGLAGIIIATTVSILTAVIVYPIQYLKIINFKAKGIWDK